ncbi:hypothetical protein [Actinoallomurus acaciae]|uniref:Uncharacterized protein n=1 Tax=Actinoallomurus acaciae TaxID=502577 RepID=A0ABV5YR76_9ACTN
MFAGWLVLVGGWMPVLALIVTHRKSWPGAVHILTLAGILLPAIGAAGTVAFGFVLGRWVPRIGSWLKIGCAAPVGCLSWVFWFAIAYAVSVAGADASTDDSGAVGAVILEPFALLVIGALLGLGAGIGVACRARATGHAE